MDFRSWYGKGRVKIVAYVGKMAYVAGKRGRAVLHIERYIVKYKKVYAKRKDIKTMTFVKLKYEL